MRKNVMIRLEKTAQEYLNVPRRDGELLRILARAIGAQRALELGASNGYSTIWIGSGLEQTSGHLWTVEVDEERATLCRQNLEEAGLGNVVTVIHGDCLKVVPDLAGPFDFVFLDVGVVCDKALQLVLPKVPDGGVIVTHDCSAEYMKDYRALIDGHTELDSVALQLPGGHGFAISLRKARGTA